MKSVRYLACLCWLLLFIIFQTRAQDKPAVAFGQVNAGTSVLGASYQQVIHETLLRELVAQNRFHVVTRSPDVWKTIEQELALQDFIDPKTALNLGKMLGARYYLDATVAQFTSDRVASQTPGNGIEYTYTSSLQLALKVVNLETGSYEEAVTSAAKVNGTSRDESINEVIRQGTNDLMKAIVKKFPNRLRIIKLVSTSQIVLDQGSAHGVKALDLFKVLAPDGRDQGTLKIIDVTPTESTGRLMTGNFQTWTLHHTALESFDGGQNNIKIEKQDKRYVILNAGSELGLKKGDVYAGMRLTEINTADRTLQEEKTLNRIYVLEVHQNYSKGKIIDGYRTVTENMALRESGDSQYKTTFFKVRYKAPVSLRLKANADKGPVVVSNTTGDYTINTNYLSGQKDIRQASIISAGIGGKNLVKDLSTTLSFDFYNMSPLQNWIAYLDISYEYPVVPEVFFVSMGGAAGYGRLKQELPQNVTGTISKNYSDELKSSSIFLGGNIGLVYELGRFALLAGISYDYLSFTKWTYEIKPDGEGSKKLKAPNDIIPYPDVDLSGLYYNVGLRYSFK